MTGHFVALSVRTESEGNLEEVEVERERRVDVFVLPRKGQDALKRASDESLSIAGEMRRFDRFTGFSIYMYFISQSQSIHCIRPAGSHLRWTF
jgi:hypothetical protein